jgi:hypothetical protein
MATATLHGAKTYCYAGLLFTANEPVAVDDKVAEDLAALPQYFTVTFDGRKAAGRRSAKPGAPTEPTATF